MKPIFTLILLFFLSSSVCNAQFISNDGEYHVLAGAVISAGTYAIVYSTTKNKKKAFWYSLGAATLAGIVKETIDSTEELNKFDAGDMAATSLGGLAASVTFSLFVGNKKKKEKNMVLVN